ncbi:hypothetical protein V5R22_30695 [Bacillus thuringiensis]|uniref:hypothetical protein n=1 Tax=Bacillus cereus group TaxID=86661 RepID=UPI00040A4153|nr:MULTISPECIES: hypothetical protein [Bacillus cereus group]KLA35972.1 hypothetical protein B4158_5864 [Bacillus cereus]MCC3901018.1 hypothetical protein [Bacillus thuringiensis]MCC3951584.1 hypothetical protein [Bacillus thuringiensis]MCC3964619.1 hypothetical protein [Bacillus thuringiensis]MCC4001938.1 hypothetical protein [Bacillus thuringiensis]
MGFQQFVLKNSFLLGDRDRYYLDELSPTAKEKLGELAKNQEKKTTTEKMYETNATAGKSSIFGNRINEFKVSEFPIKLYSLKDLLDGIEDLNMKFRYKVKVYRYLKQQGISKIKIQSLIRYRREDIESAADFSLPLVVDKEKLLSNIETVICGEDQ